MVFKYMQANFAFFSPCSIFRMSTADFATSDTFSLGQKLFHSPLDADEASGTPLDVTHVPTTQERQAHKFLQSLEEEKAESKRYIPYSSGPQPPGRGSCYRAAEKKETCPTFSILYLIWFWKKVLFLKTTGYFPPHSTHSRQMPSLSAKISLLFS